MCDPISITLGVATAGLGIASNASQASAARSQARNQYKSAYEQANNQREYYNQVDQYNRDKYARDVEYQYQLAEWQEDRYRKNAVNVQKDLQGKYGAVFEQLEQSRERTLQEIGEAGKAADRGTSFVTVSAAESGTTGNSVALSKQQYRRAEAEYANISINNLKAQADQSKRTMLAMRAQGQSQINQLMPSPMAAVDLPGVIPMVSMPTYQAPSMTPYMLGAASSILGGVTTGYQMSALQGMGTPALSNTTTNPPLAMPADMNQPQWNY